jgi:zinc finger CCHC domain-containing protein 9
MALVPAEYPYATCFICKESGHLSKSCPENPLGLYPNGGGCAFCASVEHFKRDCPDRKANSKGKPRWKINLSTASGSADADDAIVLDDPADHGNSDDEAGGLVPPKPKAKKKKVVSF